MSDTVTHGYDLVVQINEEGLNDYLNGQTILHNYSKQINYNDSTYQTSVPLELTISQIPSRSPIIRFADHIANGLTITIPFQANIELIIVDDAGNPTPGLTFSINGEMTISHPISAFQNSLGRRCIGFDFSAGIDEGNISLTLDN